MFISKGKAIDKYGIAKKLNKSYSVGYYAIEQLLKQGLIEISGTRKGEKNSSLEVETYGLTLPGLSEVLSASNMLDGKIEEIDLMIERWSHLHFVLSKWKLLRDKIPEPEVMAALQTTVNQLSSILSVASNHELLKDRGKELFLKTFFLPVLTFTQTSRSFFAVEKWIEAINSDKELRMYIRKQLEEEISVGRKELSHREELLKRI
jgi:hypothetical protein